MSQTTEKEIAISPVLLDEQSLDEQSTGYAISSPETMVCINLAYIK